MQFFREITAPKLAQNSESVFKTSQNILNAFTPTAFPPGGLFKIRDFTVSRV